MGNSFAENGAQVGEKNGTNLCASTDVVAAVIYRDSKYLVCKRNLKKRHGGLWEFPGGKVANGESFRAAIKRELDEELRVQLLEVGQSLYNVCEPNSVFQIHFLECCISGTLQNIEHEKVAWVAIEEMSSMKFAPVDTTFINAVLLAG